MRVSTENKNTIHGGRIWLALLSVSAIGVSLIGNAGAQVAGYQPIKSGTRNPQLSYFAYPASGSSPFKYSRYPSINNSPLRYRFGDALDLTRLPPPPSAVTLNGFGYAPEAMRYFWLSNSKPMVKAPRNPVPVPAPASGRPKKESSTLRSNLPVPVSSTSAINSDQTDQTPFQNLPGQVSIPIPIGKTFGNFRNYYYGSIDPVWYPYMTTPVSTMNPYSDIHGTNAGYLANYPYYHGIHNKNPHHYYLDKYHYELEPTGQQEFLQIQKYQQQLQHELEHPEHFHHIPLV